MWRSRRADERLILPGCGHMPQRDKREATLAAIVRFVRQS